MDEIKNLLLEKNELLSKFFKINADEMSSIACGNFDNLEKFYSAREGLLDILEKVDEIIERKASEVVPGSTNGDQRREIEDMLNAKNEWINKILHQDLEILSAIDDAKSDIIRELSTVRKSRKAVGAYKSGLETKTLDEEA